MGGFFAPDPPAPAPPPAPAAVTTDPTAAETQARLDTIDRNRRGLYGTIATSDAGVLQSNSPTSGKSLLGE